MNPNKLFARLILASGLVLVHASAMAVPVVAVYVRAEPVGADIVFHYTLTRSGPEIITAFEVTVRPSGYGCEALATGETLCMGNYFGMLSLMPIGTTWAPSAIISLREAPVLSAGSTTQPAGWRTRLVGLRGEGRFKMQWEYPFVPLIAAPAAQPPSYSFSIRVPASPDPRAEYMDGLFHVKYYAQDTWQDLHAQIMPPPPPPRPAGITVPAAGTTAGYTVSWQPPVGMLVVGITNTWYQLQQATDSGFTAITTSGCIPCPPGPPGRMCIRLCRPNPILYSGANLSYAVSGGAAGTYYFRVRTCASDTLLNPAGTCGDWLAGSNPVIVQ